MKQAVALQIQIVPTFKKKDYSAYFHTFIFDFRKLYNFQGFGNGEQFFIFSNNLCENTFIICQYLFAHSFRLFVYHNARRDYSKQSHCFEDVL